MKTSYFSKKGTVSGCIHKNWPVYLLFTFIINSASANSDIV